MTQLAKSVDALPVHQDAASRAQVLPNPQLDQLSFNKATQAIERWNGTAWVATVVSGTPVPVVATKAARDALYPAPSGGERVLRADSGIHERYDANFGGWVPYIERPREVVNVRQFDDASWIAAGLTTSLGIASAATITAQDILNHPEWVGKYQAGVDTRDLVALQEAIYAAFANSPYSVAARGRVASVDVPGQTLTLTFDSGAAIAGPLLVSSLPVVGSPSTRMRGAVFRAIAGKGAGAVGSVLYNTANTITFGLVDTNFVAQFDSTTQFELVKFNAYGYQRYNKPLEMPPAEFRINRELYVHYTNGGRWTGAGLGATIIKGTGYNGHIIHTNGWTKSYMGNFGISTMSGPSAASNLAQLSVDWDGDGVNAGGDGAAGHSSNVFESIGVQGVQTEYTKAGNVALTAVTGTEGSNSPTITLTGPFTTATQYDYSEYWVLFKSGPMAGRRRRVIQNNVVTAGALTLTMDVPWGALIPAAGNTVDVVLGSAGGISIAEGGVPIWIGTGGQQGSEFQFINCQVIGFNSWGVRSLTANAIDHLWKGGSIAECPNWGILGSWADWTVENAGLHSGWLQLDTYAYSDPQTYGYDFAVYNQGNATTLLNVRSESPRFLYSQATRPTYVYGCSNAPYSANGNWAAGALYSVGSTVTGTTDGRWYKVTATSTGLGVQSSANAAGEPNWLSVPPDGGSIVETVNGGPDAGKTITYTEVGYWMADQNRGRFAVINADHLKLNGGEWRGGQIALLNHCTVEDTIVGRQDWLVRAGSGWQRGQDQGNVIRNVRWQGGGIWGPNAGNNGANSPTYMGADYREPMSPVLWLGANSVGTNTQLVGVGVGDVDDPVLALIGRPTNALDSTGGFLGVETPHRLDDWQNATPAAGFPTDSGSTSATGLTDIAGRALRFLGGKSRGNALGGPIEFHVALPGASGTSVPTVANGRVFKLLQLLADKTARLFGSLTIDKGLTTSGALIRSPQAISVAAAGTATIDCTLGSAVRITAAGNFTMADPTTPTDGQELEIEVFNNTAGAITITQAPSFAVAIAPPATTKRTCVRVRYSTAGGRNKWSPITPQVTDYP